MWLSYFLAAAYIIIILRLIVFSISDGTFNEKMAKAKGWFIGLVLLTLSWGIIARVFGVDSSMKIGSEHVIKDSEAKTNKNSVPINIGNK